MNCGCGGDFDGSDNTFLLSFSKPHSDSNVLLFWKLAPLELKNPSAVLKSGQGSIIWASCQRNSQHLLSIGPAVSPSNQFYHDEPDFSVFQDVSKQKRKPCRELQPSLHHSTKQKRSINLFVALSWIDCRKYTGHNHKSELELYTGMFVSQLWWWIKHRRFKNFKFAPHGALILIHDFFYWLKKVIRNPASFRSR